MDNIIYKEILFKGIEEKDENSIIITGYPSTQDIDRVNDKMSPLAFAKSFKTYMNATGSIFYNHDWDNPIGKIISYSEPTDSEPLEITAEIYKDADEKVFNRVKLGLVKSFSVAFFTTEYKNEKIDGKSVQLIEEAELLDISIVTVPANPNANFYIVKSLLKTMAKKDIENIIDKDNSDKQNINQEDTEEIINVKKSDWDRMMKAVEGLMSDFERLINNLSVKQIEELENIISKIKGAKNGI